MKMKRFRSRPTHAGTAAILCLCMLISLTVPLGGAVAADDADPINLSLNPDAVATASYSRDNQGHYVNNCRDANMSTRWSSDASPNGNEDWVQIDLQQAYNIQQVILRWEAAYGSAYKIQTKMDPEDDWTDVVTRTNGTGGVETLDILQNARIVRMQGVTPATSYKYSLWEFEIYGTEIIPEVPVNVALGKPARASATSTENNGAYIPDNAVDGDLATRWSTSQAADNWIDVNLLNPYIISQVVINWEASYARGYIVQVSNDGAAWTDVYTETNGDGGTDVIDISPAVTARWARVQGVARSGEYGYSIYELEVYGVTPPPDPGPRWPASSSLTFENISADSITAVWTPATDNNEVTGYQVYVGSRLAATLDGGAGSYTATGLSPGRPHSFDIIAFDENETLSSPLRGSAVTVYDKATKAFSTTYPIGYSNWTNGLLAGNGKQGAIIFGDPLTETVVFNDKEFWQARSEASPYRTFKTFTPSELQEIRSLLLAGSWAAANQAAAPNGYWQDGGEGSKHPGFKMTISLPENGPVYDYARATDYSSGTISVYWNDEKGDWERTTFISRPDNVTVQYLPAPEGETLDCEVGLSVDPGMHLSVNTTQNTSVDFLNLRAKYTGQRYNAGYEGVTRIITDGQKAVSGNNVAVTNATYVLLLTRTQRYDGTFYDGGVPAETEWGQELIQNDLRILGDTYNYSQLLERHVSNHKEIFDRVDIGFNTSAAERSLTNEQLLAQQRSSATLVPALLERLFYSGRYHLMASGGAKEAPDLLGNWTGDTNVGWSGYYHLDANLNLQISGGNIGNMPEIMEGYYWLNEQWVPGERDIARDMLGVRGLVTPGNAPYGSDGQISSLNYNYPYQYVTGGMSWLLYPFWEWYQISGDKVFLEEHFYPMIREMGDFYEDFLVEKDENGKYIFLGSISPENTPSGARPLSINSIYDISGAQFALEKLIETSTLLEKDTPEDIAKWQAILDALPPYLVNNAGALAEWSWPALANSNSYSHRHSSGMMPIWPYREITPESDSTLFDAAVVAQQRKDGNNFSFSYENAGHGLLHGALIAANLGMSESVNNKLLRMARNDYYYNSLSTAHYNNYGTFAADVVNSLPTILMEMLAQSDEGLLELLPALPESLSKGSISGMLGKSRFKIDDLAWDMESKTIDVEITSDIDQTLTLIQREGIVGITGDADIASSPLGNIARLVSLEAGETVSLHLVLTGGETEATFAKVHSSARNSLRLRQTLDLNWETDATAYQFVSSNPGVASVDQNGRITALRSGTAVITLKTLDSSALSSSMVLSVTP
ncbi:MAG: discoidin domain-containing protein [Clostridiales Family XIII bacterium]|nr:discoidin domain-containing protein [Clostridiales Family XIII bacterium]